MQLLYRIWFSARSWTKHPTALGLTLAFLGSSAAASEPAETLRLVDRVVTQDQGAWVIDYRLRRVGALGVITTPEEISVKVEGWVSNSRVASHAVPRWSALTAAFKPDLTAVSEVIPSTDESTRCRERLSVAVWTDNHPPAAVLDDLLRRSAPRPLEGDALPPVHAPLSLAPGAIASVRVRLDHQHILQGDYDPLLGARSVEIKLGGATVRDVVALDREQYLAFPRCSWPEPPEERRDTRRAHSGPDSLHIEAHIPGRQFYRYPERSVRHGARMRLQFWYLIAEGTEGECRVRLAQIKDTPVSYRVLTHGAVEQCLKTVGRWTKFDRIVPIEGEATKITLEFKIAGDAEVGEMWIDDVAFEPLGCAGPSGP